MPVQDHLLVQVQTASSTSAIFCHSVAVTFTCTSASYAWSPPVCQHSKASTPFIFLASAHIVWGHVFSDASRAVGLHNGSLTLLVVLMSWCCSFMVWTYKPRSVWSRCWGLCTILRSVIKSHRASGHSRTIRKQFKNSSSTRSYLRRWSWGKNVNQV